MPFKFFVIPIPANQTVEDELNAFVRGHTVVGVTRQLVEQGNSAYWSLCVEFVDAPTARAGRSGGGAKRAEIDYREVLSESDFAVYAQLRQLRKELAQADQVPPYQVFNNLQLAEMVKQQMRTEAALRALPGVGDARVEKYGGRFLEKLIEQWDRRDETGGKSV